MDKDIQELNRTYLLIAQRLAATDLNLGTQVTGLSHQVLARLAKLSIREIDRMCDDVNLLMFQIRVSESSLMKMLEMPPAAKAAYMSSTMVGISTLGGANANET